MSISPYLPISPQISRALLVVPLLDKVDGGALRERVAILDLRVVAEEVLPALVRLDEAEPATGRRTAPQGRPARPCEALRGALR